MNVTDAKNRPTSHALPEAALLWTGVFLFAMTYRSKTVVFFVGYVLMLLWLWRQRDSIVPKLPRAIELVAYGFAVWVLVSAVFAAARGQVPPADVLAGTGHFLEFLLFIPLSAVFFHLRDRMLWVMWLPVGAVLLRIVTNIDYGSLETTLFSPKQYGFGKYYTSFGMQGMLALISACCIAVFTVQSRVGRVRRIAVGAAVVFAILLLLQAVLTSGSRTAWICTAGTFGLAVLVVLWRTRGRTRAIAFGAIAVTLVVGAAFSYLNKDLLDRRLVRGTNVDFALTFDTSQLPRDRDVFFARRVHLFAFGVDHWHSHQIVGHGPNAARSLLLSDPDFHIHPHLHSTHLEFLVELGAVGWLLIYALFLMLAWYVWRARERHGTLERVIALKCLLYTAALTVWSLPMTHLHWSDQRFAIIWLMALAAFVIRQCTSERAPSARDPHLQRDPVS